MKLLTKKEVAEFLRISQMTVDNRRKSDPDFPDPLNNGGKLVWREADLIAYLTKGEGNNAN